MERKTSDLIQKDVYCLMNTFYTVDAQHAEVTQIDSQIWIQSFEFMHLNNA